MDRSAMVVEKDSPQSHPARLLPEAVGRVRHEKRIFVFIPLGKTL